jgi:hypothetical protein
MHSSINKMLAVNLLKGNASPFRACISASQEELQTWGSAGIG